MTTKKNFWIIIGLLVVMLLAIYIFNKTETNQFLATHVSNNSNVSLIKGNITGNNNTTVTNTKSNSTSKIPPPPPAVPPS